MIFKCIHCESEFVRSHKSKYCSQACFGAAKIRRAVLQCKNCGAEFSTPLSNLKKCDVGYCSRGCYDAGRTRVPLQERFWPKVEVRGLDECWLWTGSLDSGGYGQIGIKDGERPGRAHRLAYEWANGPIPPGKQVNHTCDVRSCVNPSHLYAGTAKDNTRDAIERGRWFSPFVEKKKKRDAQPPRTEAGPL